MSAILSFVTASLASLAVVTEPSAKFVEPITPKGIELFVAVNAEINILNVFVDDPKLPLSKVAVIDCKVPLFDDAVIVP